MECNTFLRVLNTGDGAREFFRPPAYDHSPHTQRRTCGGPRDELGRCSQVESREEAAEHPEEAACEGGSADLAAAEGSSAAAGDGADSQALERLESAGEAACCLNDTFEVCLHTRRCPLQPCLTLLVQDEEGLPAALSREEGLPHAHLDLLLLWRPCRNIHHRSGTPGDM